MASARQTTSSATESNEVLKAKFQGLHTAVVTAISSSIANILDFLFEKSVIDAKVLMAVQQKSTPREQCRDLMMLLHTSKNPEAFVQLYLAIKMQGHLQWFLDRIDQCADPTVVTLLEKTYISKPTVGNVVQTLPEGEPVVGVTVLDSLLYVLRDKATEPIEVYDTDSYRLQRCISIPGLDYKSDMIACAHNRCLYVSTGSYECVHRVGLLPDAGTTKWPVGDVAGKLSLTDRHGVLVTCFKVGKIKEFSTEGKLLRQVQLSQDIVKPWHTIQLFNGQFVMCHGDDTSPVQRVCLVGSDGHVVKSFGGPPGSGSQQINRPTHIAVNSNGFVFVPDIVNRRVLLLSPALTYVRAVVSRDQLKWNPIRVCLNVDKRSLYIADCEFKNGDYVSGRVVVVSV